MTANFSWKYPNNWQLIFLYNSNGQVKPESVDDPKTFFSSIGSQAGNEITTCLPTTREGDKIGNCFAGTVIDRDVTHTTDHDFYLQSHAGTSGPAHYSVRGNFYVVNADQ
jgi:hypothetical protein